MQKKWLAVWGVASCIAPPTAAQYAKDITLRTTIRVNVGGTAVRIRLANPGTDSPVEIERATVFNLSNDAAPVAFNASPIHISGRGTVESDPVEMNVKPGDDLVVSLYLKEMTHLMSGVRVNGPLSRMAFSEGDTSMMRDPGALNITDTDAVRLLTELDVETEDDAHAIIAYGDSIPRSPGRIIWRCAWSARKRMQPSSAAASAAIACCANTRACTTVITALRDSSASRMKFRFPAPIA